MSPPNTRIFVIAGVLVGALATTVYLTIDRRQSPAQRDHIESNDRAVVETPSALANAASDSHISSPRMEVAATELRSMSETFRNSTFLVAIRGASFYCDDVISAHETTDGIWLASCRNMLGYTLSVQDVDRFDVRPIAHYFDTLGPFPELPNDQTEFDRDRLPEPLQPERFRR